MKIILVFLIAVFISSCTRKDGIPTKGFEAFMSPSQEDGLLQKALSSHGAGVHEIEIRGMNFVPNIITVNVGDTVLWLNKDFYAHDVTEFKAKKWSSSKLEPNAAWAMIASEPSEYFCSIHVVMRGSIKINADLADK